VAGGGEEGELLDGPTDGCCAGPCERASERASKLGKEGEAPSEGRLGAAPAGGREGSESAYSRRQMNKTSQTDAAVYRARREKGDAVGRRGREGRARRRACLSGSRSRPGRPPPPSFAL